MIVRLNEPFATFKRTLAFPGRCNKHFLSPPIVVADLGIRVAEWKAECQDAIVARQIAPEPQVGVAGTASKRSHRLGLIVPDLEQQPSARRQQRGVPDPIEDPSVGVEPIRPTIESGVGIVQPHVPVEVLDDVADDVGRVRNHKVEAAPEGVAPIPRREGRPAADPVGDRVVPGDAQGFR